LGTLPEGAVCAILIPRAMFSPRRPDLPEQLYKLPPRSRTLPVVQGKDCIVALKALAEDTRVNIVRLLIDQSLGVGDIATQLGVSQYNVSKHLRILREAGLVEVEKDGRMRRYALPAALRRRAAAGEVIDLGCCTFQFDAASANADQQPQPARRARSPRASSRRSR
jgi:DNA-binding transcriptional ArsR family regulator